MKKGMLIFWAIVLLIVVAGIGVSLVGRGPSVNLDPFAQCLKDKGIIFYGAFWCPHCQRTKALFGASARLLPYVECSTPDGQGQTQICIDKKIQQYPTWVFPDGSTMTGEHTLLELSAKSGCPLPSK